MKSRTVLAAAISLAICGPAIAATTDGGNYKETKPYTEYRSDKTGYSLRASDILDMDVRNATNEKIGKVDDLIIGHDDNVARAVISVGGFLGIGDKLVAIPYNELRVTADGEHIFYDATEKQLKGMQAFSYRDGELYGSDVWSDRLSLRDSTKMEKADMAAMETKSSNELAGSWDYVAGNWEQLKGKVQKEWGKLTNDDLDIINGERKMLVGRIQERYGIAQIEAEKRVDTWAKTL